MRKNILLYFFGIALIQSCNSNTQLKEEQASAPVLLSSQNQKASCAYLTSDEKNDPVISWCETDSAGKKYFFISYFNKVSQRLGDAIPVPVEQNASIHEEGMPKVAIKGDGSIIAVWETSSPTKENEWAGFVHYIQSFDKGKTWTQPLCVHADTSAGGSRSFASIARLSNGEVGVCWLDASTDYKKNGRPVKFASTEGNKGFRHEVLIEPVACECCRTAISSDGNGNISAVFRAIINDSIRDISISTSADNGKTFGKAASFSNDNWVINGCPHNGPCVANNNGISYTTWYTGGARKGIYYEELNKENKAIIKRQVSPDGKNIQLCVLDDGARMIAYNETIHEADSFYSRIIISKVEGDKIFSKNITSEKAHAFYPVVCSYEKDKIIVAWSEGGKVFYRLISADAVNNAIALPSNPHDYRIAAATGIKLTNHTDPVCGMHVDSDVQDTIHIDNKIIGFCSKYCKEKFLQSPGVYEVE
ncbi:MAG TPA: hypothetical protein VFW07_27955 [Parafilimonas sp.]|nr:hypothetical protein [Parafilimonas sp.]